MSFECLEHCSSRPLNCLQCTTRELKKKLALAEAEVIKRGEHCNKLMEKLAVAKEFIDMIATTDSYSNWSSEAADISEQLSE